MIINEGHRKNRRMVKLFIVLFSVTFVLAITSSIVTEILDRRVRLSDDQVRYSEKLENDYIFLDRNDQEVTFKGISDDLRASKTMTYHGSVYKLVVNKDNVYEFYKDNELVQVFTPLEIGSDQLINENEEAYLLVEGYSIISLVDRKIVYRILLIQIIFLIFATAIYANPRYFWQIGYFKRKNKVEPSKSGLAIIRAESIFITAIIVCFPLIRLFDIF